MQDQRDRLLGMMFTVQLVGALILGFVVVNAIGDGDVGGQVVIADGVGQAGGGTVTSTGSGDTTGAGTTGSTTSGTTTGTTGTTGTTTTGTTTELALRYRTDARRRIATQYGASIQRCFDAGDAQVPGFSGSVAMAFMLMQDGRVASTRIARDTTGIPAVSACLRQAAQSWQLPPPPPRTLELSMTFSR